MKRFFGFLLFTIILTVAYFTIASALTQPCEGAEPACITISEPLPPQSAFYPSEVYSITDTEFFKWATDQNVKARIKWEEWYKTAPPHWINYSITDYKQNHHGFYFGSNYKQGSIRHYKRRLLNPDYVSQSLTIINPYCRPKRQFLILPESGYLGQFGRS